MHRKAFIFLGLLAVTLCVFLPTLNHEFVLIDDDLHVYKNPHMERPSLTGLTRFWHAPYQGLYVPVTYTLWTLQKSIAATFFETEDLNSQAMIFHAFNILLHWLNGCLLYLLIMVFVSRPWIALLGACAFLVHPLQVEPVAWVSGQKDLLYTFFGLIALLLLLGIRKRKDQPLTQQLGTTYLFATGFFVLSLLSKPTAIVFPWIAIGLLLLSHQNTKLKHALLLVTPWILLCLPIIWITKTTQSTEHFPYIVPLWVRPLMAGDAISFYLAKILFPLNLVPDYSRTPETVLGSPLVWVAWMAPLCLWKLLALRTSVGDILFKLFLISILPVMGFVPFYFQLFSTVADRYLYFSMAIACLGLCFILHHTKSWAIPAIATSIVILFGVLSVRQGAVWQDSKTLFRHTIRISPNSVLAHNNLGTLVENEKDWVSAIHHYQETLNANRHAVAAKYNLGRLHAKLGKYAKGRDYFLEVLKTNPEVVGAQYSLGLIYSHFGQWQRAKTHLNKAFALRPNHVRAIRQLAFVHRKLGDLSQAKLLFEYTLRFDATHSKTFHQLARIYGELGDQNGAAIYLKSARRLEPPQRKVKSQLNRRSGRS